MPTEPMRVTLSFDNGPTPGVTDGVLDVLDARGAAAWFCIVGRQLGRPGAAALAERAMSEGHHLANHSMNHDVPLGDDPSPAHADVEIRAMHDMMDAHLGEWGPRWFRPFGRGGKLGQHVFSPAALTTFAELDYSVMLWNSVPRDWENPQGWIETALADVDRQPHTLVVLHDLPTGAMAELPRFLDALEARGAEITDALPTDCVPVRDGAPTTDLTALTSSPSDKLG